MGNFLSSVSSQLETLNSNPSSTWVETFTQVKQYHGYFKYVCDSFIISHEESKEIFGSLEKAKLWDFEQLGKIDALQIFCGLVIFSTEATFKKKFSFLFNMFDFNQIKSLSFIDVEVMVLSICNSVYKILRRNARTSESEIGEWLNNYLPQRERIKITTLYYFCVRNREINTFFKLINMHMEEFVPQTNENEQENGLQLYRLNANQSPQSMNQCIQWHKNLLLKMKKHEDATDPLHQEQLGCNISWVYGINTKGKNIPFIVLSETQILYKISSFVILFNLETSTQQLVHHQNEVDCFAYNHNADILATIERKSFPTINLWRKGRQNGQWHLFRKIANNHQNGVKIMQFLLREKYLVTVDKRMDSPILIFDYQEGVVVHHILLKDQIVQIFDPLIFFDSNLVSSSIYHTFHARSASKQIIYEIQLIQNRHTVHPYSYTSPIIDPITCACSCYLNLSNTSLRSFVDKSAGIAIITGHKSGSVRMLSSNTSYNEEQLIEEGMERNGIVQIKVTGQTLAFCSSQTIYLYEIDIIDSKVSPILKVNLINYQSQLHLLNYQISYFSFMSNFLLVLTQGGQFITLKPQKVYKPDQNFNQFALKPNNINRLMKFQGKNCIFCILSLKKDKQLILFVTNKNKILGIDSLTHQIHDIWQISTVQPITNIDAVCSEQGNCYVVCGSKGGKLYIRIDWEQSPKYYDCGSQIIDVKLSKDCSYLLVATSASSLLFFTQTNRNFTSPRKLIFQNQIPMSITFLDNYRYFLVVTSAVNTYQIQIPQLKHHLLQKQSQKISISQMNIRYPLLQTQNKQYFSLRSCLGATMKFSLISTKNGSMHFFNNPSALLRGCFSNLTAHQGPLSMLLVNSTCDKFYSLGKYDNTLIEWSIFQCKKPCDGNGQILQNHERSIKISSNAVKSQQLFQSMQYFVTNQLIESSNYFLSPDQQQYLNTLHNSNYFFKASRNQRLNEIFQAFGSKDWSIINSQLAKKGSVTAADIDSYFRRVPDISLQTSSVYGLDSHRRDCVSFDLSGQNVYTTVSRFIMKTNLKSKEQTIYEPTNRRITFLACHSDGNIFYSIAGSSKIFILFKKSLQTSHHKGVLHFKIYKQLIISYGVNTNQYSINLHNYLTGELIHNSCTNDQINQFIVASPKLIVSLPKLRVWKNLYPSPCYGVVTAGCLLPNKDDLLFSVGEGQLYILNAKKSFWQSLGIRAHEKAIDFILAKIDESDNSNSQMEIITIGQDEKLKIWSQNFECRIMINFRQRGNLTFFGEENKKTQINGCLLVKSVDIFQNRVLLVFHTGQVAQLQFKWNRQVKKMCINETNGNLRHQNKNMLNFYELSRKSIDDGQISQYSDKSIAQMTYTWSNILNFHSSRSRQTFNRRFFFSVNQVHPLLATSASENQIIIMNHQTNVQVCQCFFDGMVIDYVKFLPNGRLIALGFSNGDVKFYEVKIYRNQQEQITSVSLKFFQTFTSKGTFDGKNIANNNSTINQEQKTQIVSMQFSQCGTYFVVSYITRNDVASKSFLQIFKTRQPASVEHGIMQNEPHTQTDCENQYYFLCDTLIISEQAKTGSQKYLRSVYFMTFLEESVRTLLNMTNIKSFRQMKSTSSLAFQDKNERGVLHLVFYEQYITENLMRVNGDSKVKIKAYNMQERTFAKEEYGFNFLKWKFPHFVNGKEKSNIQTPDVDIASRTKSQPHQKKLYDKFEEETIEIDMVISQMLFFGNEAIFYGDQTGKIHSVKYGNLFNNEEYLNKSDFQKQGKNKNEIDVSEMSLAKTYISQTSFINQMELSSDQQYLFTSGAVDDCVVKYKISVEAEGWDLDSICYPVQAEDPHQEYLSKTKFHDFLNNIEPIREEISEVMMDVETTKQFKKIGLEMQKVFGRRSFDRSNNLYHDGLSNLVYTLGPNIVLQDEENSLKQKIINVDTDTYSNSPQISCTSFVNSCLIVATEEQFSRIFVWDIYSLTCLNHFKLKNYSIIYHIAQSSYQKAFLAYGVNCSFQPLVQLINWQAGSVLGNYSLMHSGCWKIKDICEFVHKGDGLQFVSCGVQHLAFWEHKAGRLISSSFEMGSRLNETTFLTVRTSGNTVITGCESGVIYLWSNFQLIYNLPLHSTAIRSLYIKENYIFSAGKDSKVYISQLINQEAELSLRVQEQFQIQVKNSPENSELNLAEQDIQSLAIADDMAKIYAGTRSGSIYCVERKESSRVTQEKEMKEQSDILQCVLSAHDNDTIAHMSFDSSNPNVFYILTVSGIIEVWSLSHLNRLGHFQLAQEACKIFCIDSQLLVTCDKNIFVVTPNFVDQKLNFNKGLSREFDGTITDCVISKKNENGKYLFAVGIRKTEFNEIIIHQIGDEITEKFVVANLKYEIEFMDFSRDCKYLLFKDSFEELGMVNLLTFKRINTIFVDMAVEWEAEGLRISPYGQRIYCSYSRDNKITCIKRLGSEHIIIGDEMGTLRIFQYPCPEEKLGQLHLACYSSHMNYIKNIVIHPTLPYVLTSSIYDRSVILWKVAGDIKMSTHSENNIKNEEAYD